RIKLGDWRGEAIGDIPTNYEGLNLGDLYNRFLGNLTPCRYRQLDMSDFYLGLTRLVDKGSIKARANDYYLGLMALEQVYGPGISMGSNPDFTRRVVGPALVKAAEMLGVVPTVLARTDYPDFSLLNGRDPGLVIATKYKDMAELEADLNLRRVQDER
ncbi:MAG: hypothetical protein QG623_381, partial [Patescibacteria group bacterium]|nr:hypothetical protein [Patescibacteria group bacterium]